MPLLPLRASKPGDGPARQMERPHLQKALRFLCVSAPLRGKTHRGLPDQRILAELHALADFGDQVRAFRDRVLELDRRLEPVLLLLHELENLLDGRIALTPRDIRTVILLSILEVDVSDPVVVLLKVL